MNFLAHLYLSGDDPEMRIGNFIADAVKGNKWETYPDGIGRGIRLHRAIDSYTDNHPVVRQSIQRLQSNYHKYAGVIVDMLYDHFLAKYWHQFHSMPLEKFVDDCYKLMQDHEDIMPARARRVLSFMTMQNWLVSYANLDSLDRYYRGMASRTPYHSGMENAIVDINLYYTEFEKEFRAFFPEIVSFASEWRENN